jgi:hypothetical protein
MLVEAGLGDDGEFLGAARGVQTMDILFIIVQTG